MLLKQPKERSGEIRSTDPPQKSVSTTKLAPVQEECSNNGTKWQPNKLSENIMKCLILIYVRLIRISRQSELEKSGPISRSMYSSLSFRTETGMSLSTSLIKESKQQDPYGDFDIEGAIPRDIGPYKNLVVFSSTCLDPKYVSNSSSIPLFQKLRYVKILTYSTHIYACMLMPNQLYCHSSMIRCMLNKLFKFNINRPFRFK